MALSVVFSTLFTTDFAQAQESAVAAPATVVSAPASAPGAAVPGAASAQPSPGTKPGEPVKPNPDPNAKKDGQPAAGDAAKPAVPATVPRPSAPPEPPNPDELKVKPNAEGMVQFEFRNQPWPELLKWLAQASHLSLDWQELPADYLNLATQRPYSLVETRDVINRHLLSRGFTMLEQEGVLTVVKVASLSPAMVPRINPDDLPNQPPHRFVRTSFKLSFLIAADVQDEFKSMMSPNGKITALAATNRLEVMDAAANLLDIHRVLNQEQSAAAMDDLAREFPLVHARAATVKSQLEAFLGVEKSNAPAVMSPQQMQQMQQQMQMEMQMQQQGGGKAKAPAGKNAAADIHIVANDRNNSIIVHAPPNKMAIVASFIARVDVRNGNSDDFQRMQGRMKTFRLAALDPKQLVTSLTEMDVLEPSTRLQVDEKNFAIIAYASIADQYVIQSVIDKLDGSGREFEVIQLRRLEAESVAGTIQFLMGASEEKQDDNESRYRYYGYYGDSSSSKKKNEDKMRVGANVEDNQILLWANEVEMEEVQNLLVKLGEIPPEGGRANTMRVIDASRQPETFEYLRRIKEQWERLSPNPLVIPGAEEFEDPDARPVPTEPNKSEESSGDVKVTKDSPPANSSTQKLTVDNSVASVSKASIQAAGQLAIQHLTSTLVVDESGQDDSAGTSQTATVDSESAAAETSDKAIAQPQEGNSVDSLSSRKTFGGRREAALPSAAPISIMLDADGNLVVQSSDTQALDRLEQMMHSVRPPKRDYDVFQVKHLTATWIAIDLKDYFKDREEKKDNSSSDRFFSYYYGIPPSSNKTSGQRQLGKKAPISFLANNDSNTIIVQNASDADRQTIKDLIELWDVPEPVNTKNIRVTRPVRVRYSRAETIVEAIKDVYRDLLSTNDKAFQQQNSARGNGDGSRGRSDFRWNNEAEVVSPSGGLNFTFKGKLSLGVDQVTNTILVSADGLPLLELVCKMIEELDQAARPQGNVEVYKLSPSMSGASIEKALRAMVEKKEKQQPQQQRPGQPLQPGQNGQNGQPGNAGESIEVINGN